MVDVVELHQGPVARARGETLVVNLLEEGDRCLAAQGGERAVAHRVVQRPELQGAQIDVREWNLRRSLAVHAGGDSPACVTHT